MGKKLTYTLGQSLDPPSEISKNRLRIAFFKTDLFAHLGPEGLSLLSCVIVYSIIDNCYNYNEINLLLHKISLKNQLFLLNLYYWLIFGLVDFKF